MRDGAGAVDGIEYPEGLVVSPDGRSVYVLASGGGGAGPAVTHFARNSTTGALSFRAAYREEGLDSNGLPVRGIAMAPDGRDVYAIGQRSLVTFARNAVSGALQHRDTVEEGPGLDPFRPDTILVTPDGRHVLVGTSGYDLHVFVRDETGEPRLLGATRLARAPALSLHADPRGDQVYAIGGGGANALDRNLATGLLAVRDPHATTIERTFVPRQPGRDVSGGGGRDHAGADGLVRRLVDEDERAGCAIVGVGVDEQWAGEAEPDPREVVQCKTVGGDLLERPDVEHGGDLVEDRTRPPRRVLDGEPRTGLHRPLAHPADDRLQLSGRGRRVVRVAEHVPPRDVELVCQADDDRLALDGDGERSCGG